MGSANWEVPKTLGRNPPPKCKKCNDVFLKNPKSKLKGICRECENDVGMQRLGKGFRMV